MVHVLVANQLNDEQRGRLQAVSPQLVITDRQIKSAHELEAALTVETEVLYGSHYGNFDMSRGPGLRWLQVESAGVNHLHGTAVWRSELVLTSGNGVHAVQIGEYVLAMLLAHFHRLPAIYRLQARAEWPRRNDRLALRATELRGLTVGIVGYGAIGREVARLASALGMRVLATKRESSSPRFTGWTPPGTGDPDGVLPERYVSLDRFGDLLAASDAVVLTLPLTAATRHIVGPRELAAMRPHALLVNIGRGPLIDQNALIETLRAGRIGGAALDVTDPEPLPADSPLWQMENAIITPHVSGMSSNHDDRAIELFAENLRRYLAGEPLLNVVDREQGY